jgi:DNA ligase-1
LFHAPDWFVEQLPKTPLDGELWRDRKSFQRTVSIVRRQDKSELWRELNFVVFDAPTIDDVFERRIEAVRDLLAARPAGFARLLEQQRCRDLEHLRAELDRVDSLGGEGLMLREPGSRYEAGRSSTLLKVKRFHDAEARVLEHLPGAGRHKGRLGALAVALDDGTQFSVGTGFSDAQRERPPAIGSLITFRYQELSDRGVPRFPSFVRVRVAATTELAATGAAQTSSASAELVTGKKAGPRHFEFAEGGSAKFWEVTVQDTQVTVRFGRIGAAGQTQTKQFGDSESAERHAEKLIGEKTRKGYVEGASE